MIQVKALTKYYGSLCALDNVNLIIEAGQSLGLVGESGSGKSTLARLILKLIEPTSGEIIYNGISNLRKDCQIVFQDPQTSLNPRITIGDAIEEPMIIHGLKPRVSNLLEMVNLPAEYARRWPHELSGGERQRVGIARALATDPKFLILDEPVSSLDLSIQVQILDLLKELKSKLNLTYLFIAHDLAVIKYVCDKVAVMHEGKIVEIGEVKEVFNTPKDEYTKKLLLSA